MGMLDELGHVNPQAIQTTKPTRGRFTRDGYFDWENPAHATTDKVDQKKKEAVGVILPPYPTYLAERIAAAKAGIPFTVPFWVQIGAHVIGAKSDKSKVFGHCRRNLIRSNKVGQGYPMLHPDIIKSLDESCPICDACWDIVWPECDKYKSNKQSPEWKQYKDAHKQLCPQDKYVMNYLPAGSGTPILLEVPKTLGEAITNLHYDSKQPDLLWPYTLGQFSSCWIQMQRHDQPDTTVYTAMPVYVNQPHVRNQQGAFDEAMYLAIISKIKDLRDVSKDYLPDEKEMSEMVAKKDKLLTFSGLATARAVMAQVDQATAGVAGNSATPPPFITSTPPPVAVNPASSMPPAISAVPPSVTASAPPPIANAPAMPPMVGAAPPATPPAPVQPASSTETFKQLQDLLGVPAAK